MYVIYIYMYIVQDHYTHPHIHTLSFKGWMEKGFCAKIFIGFFNG